MNLLKNIFLKIILTHLILLFELSNDSEKK